MWQGPIPDVAFLIVILEGVEIGVEFFGGQPTPEVMVATVAESPLCCAASWHLWAQQLAFPFSSFPPSLYGPPYSCGCLTAFWGSLGHCGVLGQPKLAIYSD